MFFYVLLAITSLSVVVSLRATFKIRNLTALFYASMAGMLVAYTLGTFSSVTAENMLGSLLPYFVAIFLLILALLIGSIIVTALVIRGHIQTLRETEEEWRRTVRRVQRTRRDDDGK